MLGDPFLALRTARLAFKVDLVPAQVYQLTHPQAVAIGQQDHGRVPMAVTVTLGCIHQPGDLGISQVFSGLQLGLGRRVGLTVRISVLGVTSFKCDFTTYIAPSACQLFV